jgi:hypothetical protein
MIKFPLVIQRMDNKDTNNHTPSRHPKITEVDVPPSFLLDPKGPNYVKEQK